MSSRRYRFGGSFAGWAHAQPGQAGRLSAVGVAAVVPLAQLADQQLRQGLGEDRGRPTLQLGPGPDRARP